MSSTDRKARRNPTFRVESLEDRELMTGTPTDLAGSVAVRASRVSF